MRSLPYPIILFFLQRCQAQYNYYGYQVPNMAFNQPYNIGRQTQNCQNTFYNGNIKCVYPPNNVIGPYHTLPSASFMLVQSVPVMLFTYKSIKNSEDTEKSTTTSFKTTTTTHKTTTTTGKTTTKTQTTTKTTTKKTTETTKTTTKTKETSTEPGKTTKNMAKLKSRSTRNLIPDDVDMKTTRKIELSQNTVPSNDKKLQLLSIEDYSGYDDYFDYPDLKKKVDVSDKCKNAANCYSRNWNKEGEPIKLYLETNSSLMPLVRLRPTIKRRMAQTPKYKLRALHDDFVKKLMVDLKNKQVLVLERT